MNGKLHFTEAYLLNPPHAITISLIGLGGNGSQMLTFLARINATLLALDHPGLHITAFDPDTISEANIGRQLFSEADIGRNKAHVLIERLNRFFGTTWAAHGDVFPVNSKSPVKSNFYITCVDSLKARRAIYKAISKFDYKSNHEHKPYYWMDLGNSSDFGQFILESLGPIKQPKSEHETVDSLPGLFKLFPAMLTKKEDKSVPSCSLAEAIEKQDLFVNSIVAVHAADLIWKMFREAKIEYHGAFINLATSEINRLNFQ